MLLVVPSGYLRKAQPYAMRAPEVFLGQPCTEPCQVWAIAAMLLVWIKPGILGAWRSPHSLIDDSWSMAKVKRLFPHWYIPTPDEVEGHVMKDMVDSARYFSDSEEVPELQAILPFDQETNKMEMPEQLRDLLRFMFVVDPVKRPSAVSVLASGEFQALEKLVSA
jgi:serine/threonine protein kinase